MKDLISEYACPNIQKDIIRLEIVQIHYVILIILAHSEVNAKLM